MDTVIPVVLSVLLITSLIAIGLLLWQRRGSISSSPESPERSSGTPQADKDLETTGGSSSQEGRYSMLFVGDEDAPLMSIEAFDPGALHHGTIREIAVDERQISPLQNVFRHVPQLVKNVSAIKPGEYIVKVSPEAQRRIAEGSWEFVKSADGGFRGMIRDAGSKRFTEHVTLVKQGISKGAVFASVFQVLAIATAQYYLPQINRRLTLIEGGVKDLQDHLESHDRAVLTGAVRHLRIMSSALEGRELKPEEFRHELSGLDGMDRDCGKVLDVYRGRMVKNRRELEEAGLSALLKPKFDVATAIAERYERDAMTTMQAAYVRTIIARMHCILPSDYRLEYTRNTLGELSMELDEMREESREFSARFEERIKSDAKATIDLDDLTIIFGGEDTIEEKRREIVGEERERRENILGMRDQLDDVVKDVRKQTDRQITSASEPLTLVVNLDDDGEIESLAELTRSPASPQIP